MFSNSTKSCLAPMADRVASFQLNFLILNSPFTVVINNYKSNFVDLTTLRSAVIKNNGFSYHPNRNVKTRAFKGFSTALSPNVLNGLVVFAFFKEHRDLMTFLKLFESFDSLSRLSYFSVLVNGHVSTKQTLLNSIFNIPNKTAAVGSISAFNKNVLANSSNIFHLSITKISLILNAYTKSIN